MTVGDLLARFPEVPADLRDEPILTDYVRAFGPCLAYYSRCGKCEMRATSMTTKSSLQSCYDNDYGCEKLAG